MKDRAVHREVIEKITDYAEAQGLGILGLSFSPIKGPEGNIEYLVYFDKQQKGMEKDAVRKRLEAVVEQSHATLSERKEGEYAEGGADTECGKG